MDDNEEKKTGVNLDYRALFEQTGECVFIIGLDFKFVTANPQALRLLGYEEARLTGLPVENIVVLEEPGEREALFLRHPGVFESILKKSDNTLLPVELGISVVRDDAGAPMYIQALARAISDQKQAQLGLKRHIRALAVIGETTAGLVRSPNIEVAIPEVLESLGYAAGVFCCALFSIDASSAMKVEYQWVGHEAAGFDIHAALRPFAGAIADNPTRVFSVTGAKFDNAQVPVVSILVIPIQGAMGLWGFLGLFDRQNHLAWLTSEFDMIQAAANLIGAALERLRYEEAIRLSEMRNRILVDALPDLLVRADLEGRILDYNANPSHPLYAPRESVVGGKLQDVWPEDVVKMILETREQDAFVSSHRVHGFSLPNYEQTFEARLHPISAAEALIIVRDITEQARLDQMKSDFINRASHELRTPLTGAMLMTELLQKGGPKEEMDEYWRALMNELNRQKELIDQLLLAGRLESGRVHLEIVPMDLMPVLRESMLAVKAVAARRNISIKLDAGQAPYLVLGDAGGLSQVFINLLNNAVKFSPEGKTVEVTATTGEDEAGVSIADHGLGIPPDAIPHLFERFYRAKNVTVAEIPGSGIGLYIVKSIVDELGGTISVASELNRGTTFTVRLRGVKDELR
jgi:PAS domain S-box-containing protein